MFIRLLLLLICIPLIELWLLLRVGERIGPGNTFLLVIITGVIGAHLARQQGLRAWHDARQQSAQGQIPGAALADGVMILISGVLLMTPGIITDGFGFLLLCPPFRRVIRTSLKNHIRVQTHMPGGGFGGPPGPGPSAGTTPQSGPEIPPDVIDVDHQRHET
ncbi:MAG: FxsA family protein [Planctomycetaceae bacterium]|jgi:UPF0716 protein FxsA